MPGQDCGLCARTLTLSCGDTGVSRKTENNSPALSKVTSPNSEVAHGTGIRSPHLLNQCAQTVWSVVHRYSPTWYCVSRPPPRGHPPNRATWGGGVHCRPGISISHGFPSQAYTATVASKRSKKAKSKNLGISLLDILPASRPACHRVTVPHQTH